MSDESVVAAMGDVLCDGTTVQVAMAFGGGDESVVAVQVGFDHGGQRSVAVVGLQDAERLAAQLADALALARVLAGGDDG